MKVHLELTLEQADALSKAADLYTRMTLGQLSVVAELVNYGEIPSFAQHEEPRRVATHSQCLEIDTQIRSIASILGYSSGSSLGIGSPHVSATGKRNFEIKKVLDKVVAETRNPNPGFRGVNYDGLTVRYTQDPAPVARVEGGL